jgi:hypothetical protein
MADEDEVIVLPRGINAEVILETRTSTTINSDPKKTILGLTG